MLALLAQCCAIGVVVLSAGFFTEQVWAQANGNGAVERGKKLFERVWQPKQDVATKSDGLGPLFNERSCLACHFLGGVGGAGPIAANVELLSPVIPESAQKLKNLPRRLVETHRGFAAANNLVLHRFGTDPKYETFREGLLGPKHRATNSGWQAPTKAALRTVVDSSRSRRSR